MKQRRKPSLKRLRREGKAPPAKRSFGRKAGINVATAKNLARMGTPHEKILSYAANAEMRGKIAKAINAVNVFQPTHEQRQYVERATAAGISLSLIADCFDAEFPDDAPMSVEKLKRHFETELKVGTARATIKAGDIVFDGLDGKSMEAAKYFLARRGGWSEKSEVTGAGGAPLHPPAPPPIQVVFGEETDDADASTPPEKSGDRDE